MRFHHGPATRVAILWALALLIPLAAVGASVTEAGAEEEPTTAQPTGVPATIGGYPVWAHFTDPLAHDGRDDTIHDEVVRLIDNAPAGATIRGTIYSLTVQPVARALVAAQDRGVNVVILLDGKNAASTGPAVAIIKQLGTHTFCGYPPAAYEKRTRAGNACISTSDAGDLHTKMFTFSQTTDPTGVLRSNVSWFGSANMTYASGSDQFNNAITVYGDATLAAGLNRNFADMWARRHYRGNDYYDGASRRGYYPARAASVYASPEGRGQTDTIATRLNDVTPNANCRVRIGMNFVTAARPALLRVITKLRAGKCRVWVMAGTARGKIEMDRSVYDALIKAGVGIRRAPSVHDKYFMVYGKFGSRYQYQVYTGSQNWSGSALNTNDEIFVKMAPESTASHPLYDGYLAHFVSAWLAGKQCAKGGYPCR
jgi:phosphatidylserine/phosphatidylglycerophosphate/cardiolipin synthase-like enzyme